MLSNGRFTGFNSHPRLEGSHAFLSASNHHWLGYTEDRLIDRLRTSEAAALGTELHETAARNIKRKIKLMEHPDYPVLSHYVNDAIDLDLVPEQLLFYSMNAYGTADTIGFEEFGNHEQYSGYLRIHDFKSGVSKTSVDQLYVYAAFFCLEYSFRPYEIDGELRIYQGENIRAYELDRGHLANVYDKTRYSNKIIEQRRMGGLV